MLWGRSLPTTLSAPKEVLISVDPSTAKFLPIHVVDHKIGGRVNADKEMAEPGDDIAEALHLAVLPVVVAAHDQLVEIRKYLETLTSDEDRRQSDQDHAQVVLLPVLPGDPSDGAGRAVGLQLHLEPGALGREELAAPLFARAAVTLR